jgi:predicted DNA repair protein MutK
VAVLVAVAIVMTVGVYGIVAGIVKLDDAGLWLSRRASAAAQATGRMLLALAPRLMKALSVIGTIAMFMVGGGIIGHAFAPLHHLAESAGAAMRTVPALGGVLAAVTPTIIDALAGVLVGAVVLLAVTFVQRLRSR